MANPGTLARLCTHDTGRRLIKKHKTRRNKITQKQKQQQQNKKKNEKNNNTENEKDEQHEHYQ